MAYKGSFACGTYREAVDLLSHARDKDNKPLGNNTYLVRQTNGDISIRHWRTDVITFKKNGNLVLDSNGYHTQTTGARYRAFCDIAPYSYKGNWITEIGAILYVFDGLELEPDGHGGWDVVKGTPVILDSIQILLKKKIPDVAALIREIHEMPMDLLLKIWNKFKKHRTFLAKYCTPEFLPLTMATKSRDTVYGGNWKDEGWRKIVTQRLREE